MIATVPSIAAPMPQVSPAVELHATNSSAGTMPSMAFPPPPRRLCRSRNVGRQTTGSGGASLTAPTATNGEERLGRAPSDTLTAPSPMSPPGSSRESSC